MALAALALILGVAFIPGTIEDSIALRWAILALAPCLMLLRQACLTAGHTLIAAMVVWAAISLFWAPVEVDGVNAVAQLMLGGAVFCLGAATDDLKPAYIGLAFAVWISAALAVAQVFGFDGIAQSVAPAGLFTNKNFLAEIAALSLVACIGLRMWRLAIGPLVAIAVTTCREVWVALAVVACAWLWQRSRAAALACVCVAALAVALTARESNSIAYRLDLWGNAIQQFTLAGNGAGAYDTESQKTASDQMLLTARAEHAHNDYIEAVFDYGIGTIFALALIVYAMGSAPRNVESAVLLCLLVESAFGFPWHLPATAFVGSLVAGRLCASRASLRMSMGHGGHLGIAGQWA